MGIAQIPAPSTSTTKTLGLSVLSTNSSITSLPTGKSITAVLIGGGGSGGGIASAGSIAAGGSGGGASGQVKEITFSLTSSVTASCTIGAGGAGVANGGGADGNHGGDTTLNIPGLFTLVAKGGTGSKGSYGSTAGFGGGGGGHGGAGGSGSGGNGGNAGILGQGGAQRTNTGTYEGHPGGGQNITQQIWTFPCSSVTNATTTVGTPYYAPYIYNVLPGQNILVHRDLGSTSFFNQVSSTYASTPNSFNLTQNYTGDSVNFAGTGTSLTATINQPQSVLSSTIDLLTAANIMLPGGGGGGGGGNYTSGSGRTGGFGAGTGGAGGSGGYSDTGNNNIRATNGTNGAQPGGGGGGTGGYGYQDLSGPASGNTASGGNGAVYFFWVA